MSQRRVSRRAFTQWSLTGAASWSPALLTAGLFSNSTAAQTLPQSHTGPKPTIAIIGGGFGGATAARMLRNLLPAAKIILIEASPVFTACPFSNLVISTNRRIEEQQFRYTKLEQLNIEVVNERATAVDPVAHKLTLASGESLAYDKLIMSPGIQLDYTALPGYTLDTTTTMPHAWKAGEQTLLLRKQLQSLPKGGLVVISAPPNPFRCPPGPYERASLMAHYLSQHNPTAKVLILDTKDKFSKQPLFQAAWQQRYGQMIEWVGASDSGRVRAVDAKTGVVETDFDQYTPDLANIIPPQKAAEIAARCGLVDQTGWCPINTQTFASTLVDDVHVLGDATIANAMPKSAFAANAQAKVCALQIARLMYDQPPLDAKLVNTCYSLIAPNFGISVAGVYQPQGNRLLEVAQAGGTSAPVTNDPKRVHTAILEAEYAYSWFNTLSAEIWG